MALIDDGVDDGAPLDARTEIVDFIEAYYNTHCKHSSLGYRTPAQFEADLNSIN